MELGGAIANGSLLTTPTSSSYQKKCKRIECIEGYKNVYLPDNRKAVSQSDIN